MKTLASIAIVISVIALVISGVVWYGVESQSYVTPTRKEAPNVKRTIYRTTICTHCHIGRSLP